MLSRSGVAVYSRLPIFGYLRAAVAVIRKDELFLVIRRADGRGFSFPGGLALPWETPQRAVIREVREETGLNIEKCGLLFEYRTTKEVLCILTVFEAEAIGELTDSWEGFPCWLSAGAFREQLLPSQKEIMNRIVGAR